MKREPQIDENGGKPGHYRSGKTEGSTGRWATQITHPRHWKGWPSAGGVSDSELQMRNLVAQNLLVDGGENQSLKLRLRHQQPVKAIAVKLR